MAATTYRLYGTVARADILACLPRMRAFARVLSADRDRADRLVRDAIGRVWNAAHPDPATTSLPARLYRLVHVLHHADPAVGKATMKPPNDPFGPAFWLLADHQRELLVLEGVLQLSRAEIALVSGWSPAMVEVLLNQARSALVPTMAGDPVSREPLEVDA
jgi:RNA polymerase sigma-70 factor (ECF subfamily)